MDTQDSRPLTRKQQRRSLSREIVSNWASAHGLSLIGNGINTHNQAAIHAAALEAAGVTVYEVRQESANTSSVHHDEIDYNGILTGRDVRTHWAKKSPPYGRLAALREWVELLEAIGQAGTVENLPEIEITEYEAGILRKHLADPYEQVKRVIEERYAKEPAKPFKKAYHAFDLGDDTLFLGIKLSERRLKVEYRFNPERDAWLKSEDLNIKGRLSQIILESLPGKRVGDIMDTQGCPHLAALANATIIRAHCPDNVTSLRLQGAKGSLQALLAA